MTIEPEITESGEVVYVVFDGVLEVARFGSRIEAERYVAGEPRHPRADYRRGEDANRSNKPRDPKQNIDWLAGWDCAEADRCLDLEP